MIFILSDSIRMRVETPAFCFRASVAQAAQVVQDLHPNAQVAEEI